MVIAKKHC